MNQTKDFYCSDLAAELGVPLPGSATRGDTWFLLEYPARWGAKALEESDLRDTVKDALTPKNYPKDQARTLLIRQPASKGREGIKFFVAQTAVSPPRMYEYDLEEYDDLLALDLAALAAGGEGDPAHLRANPLYLVCVNGKRDKCCARNGIPAFQQMEAAAGELVWQSSHIGGHNLGPNMLFFPQGINYGRAAAEKASKLVETHAAGQISLTHFRGRVACGQPLQAAEFFWRQETGHLGLDDFQLIELEETAEDEWQVTASRPDSKDCLAITFRRQVSEELIPITCAQTKTKPIQTFRRF